MTNTTSAYDATTIAGPTSLRVATIAALVGGAALILDTVTITVINSNFGPIDDVLFFVGLAGLAATLVALSVHLSARATGAARIGLGGLVFIAIFIVLGGLSYVADLFGRHAFSDANIGLHGEWSFFSIGVALLVIAVWLRLRSRAA